MHKVGAYLLGKTRNFPESIQNGKFLLCEIWAGLMVRMHSALFFLTPVWTCGPAEVGVAQHCSSPWLRSCRACAFPSDLKRFLGFGQAQGPAGWPGCRVHLRNDRTAQSRGAAGASGAGVPGEAEPRRAAHLPGQAGSLPGGWGLALRAGARLPLPRPLRGGLGARRPRSRHPIGRGTRPSPSEGFESFIEAEKRAPPGSPGCAARARQ